MNICIGGDLDGKSFEFEKIRFNASEVDEGKSSDYYKQKYIIDDDQYCFWIEVGLNLGDATDLVEAILRKPKN